MDLEQKLEQFKSYYNQFRVHQFGVHQSLEGTTPEEKDGGSTPTALSLGHYGWPSHCHGLFQLPIAA